MDTIFTIYRMRAMMKKAEQAILDHPDWTHAIQLQDKGINGNRFILFDWTSETPVWVDLE